MAQYLPWVDNSKAICMIGVYLLHSEAYYGVGNFRLGIIFSPFYVNLFFFVSGYLLFFKLFKTNKLNGGGMWDS